MTAQIASIRRQIEEAKARAVTMADVGRAPSAESAGRLQPAINLEGLERTLTRASQIASRFSLHPQISGAYILTGESGDHTVTFRRRVFEDHPGQVALLTYGTDEFDELLADTPVRDETMFRVGDASASTLAELEHLLSPVAPPLGIVSDG